MYEVLFTDKADRQLKKLDPPIQRHIIAVLGRARIRPEMFATKLIGDTGYKLRAGDYRILVEIDQQKQTLLVMKVGHRKNVYDER